MADDAFEIKLGVDKSAVAAGLSDVTGNVQAFVDDLNTQAVSIGGTYAKVFSGISADSKAMAANLSADQLRIGEVSRVATFATSERRAALRLLNSEVGDVAVKTRVYAATLLQEREAVQALSAATKELAGSQEAAAVATHSVVSGQQAASAAIRGFEGSSNLRGIENFIAKTLGLGPALQMIFPLVGGLAFVEMLFHIGEKLYDMEQKAAHAGEEINRAFAEVTDQMRAANLELTVTSDKLEDANAKLSGRPGNGLRTGIDEAELAAQKLGGTLDKDLDKIKSINKQNNVGFWGGLLSNTAQTGDTEKLLVNAKAEIDRVRHEYARVVQEANATGNPENIAQAGEQQAVALIKVYAEQSKRIQEARDAAAGVQEFRESTASTLGVRQTKKGGGVEYNSGADQNANLATLNGGLRVLEEEQEEIGGSMRKGAAETEHAVLEAHKAGAEEENKAAKARLAALEEALSERQGFREMEPAQVAQYWAQYLGEFQRGSTEYKHVLDEMTKYTEEARKQRFQDALKSTPDVAGRMARTATERREAQAAIQKDQEAGDKALEEGTRAVEKWGEKTPAAIKKAEDAWKSYFTDVAKGQEIAAAMAETIEMAQLKALEASGGITRLGAAQVEAAMHAKEHAAALKVLQDQLEAAEQAAERTTNPATGKDEIKNGKDAAEIQKLKNQIAQMSGKGAAQAIGDQARMQADLVAPYTAGFQKIGQDFIGLSGTILKGQKSIAQGFREMAANMAMDVIQGFEKMGLKALQHEIITLAAHRAGNLAKTKDDEVAAVKSKGIKEISGFHEIFIDAKSAAASAWKAVSAIPVIGPALAPEAAAATFAGVMALASFDVGTNMVPANMVALIHAGERIVPAADNARLMDAVEGGGGNSGPSELHLHMGGNSFSSANGDFRQQLSTHEDHLISIVKRARRDGKI